VRTHCRIIPPVPCTSQSGALKFSHPAVTRGADYAANVGRSNERSTRQCRPHRRRINHARLPHYPSDRLGCCRRSLGTHKRVLDRTLQSVLRKTLLRSPVPTAGPSTAACGTSHGPYTCHTNRTTPATRRM